MGRSAAALVAWLGPLAPALLIASNCNAPNWQDSLMMWVLPVVSAVGLGVAAIVSKERPRRIWVGVTVAVIAVPLTWFAVVAVRAGGCGGFAAGPPGWPGA